MPYQKKRRQGKEKQGPDSEFEQRILDLARVTRVMKGGKRMRFRACMVLGDQKGKVGIAVAKGADVTIAISKAVAKARKKLITVPIVEETIPHEVRMKFGAAKILIKPAPKGTGIKAGGVMRSVLELAGIGNVVGKILGSKNKINISQATIEALKSLRKVPSATKEKEVKETGDAKTDDKSKKFDEKVQKKPEEKKEDLKSKKEK